MENYFVFISFKFLFFFEVNDEINSILFFFPEDLGHGA